MPPGLCQYPLTDVSCWPTLLLFVAETLASRLSDRPALHHRPVRSQTFAPGRAAPCKGTKRAERRLSPLDGGAQAVSAKAGIHAQHFVVLCPGIPRPTPSTAQPAWGSDPTGVPALRADTRGK